MSYDGLKSSPTDAEKVAALALLLTPGVGVTTVNQLLAAAQRNGHSLCRVLDMTQREVIEILPVGFTEVAAAVARCTTERQEHARRLIDRLVYAGGRVVFAGDDDYPGLLKVFLRETAPPLLFVRGNTALFRTGGVAVVGARNISGRGADLARACAETFAREGAPIVSGAASGVDTIAHTAALAAEGTTVVVLPQGLLTYNPPKSIREAVDQGKAVLLSEFQPDAPWQTHAAVTRNATISALSLLVCVIEPRKAGGSVRTARLAIQQRKQVLLYVSDPSDAVLRSFAGSGAVNLLDVSGELNAKRLADYWRSACGRPLPDEELF